MTTALFSSGAVSGFSSNDENSFNGGIGGAALSTTRALFEAQGQRRAWSQVFWGGQHLSQTAQAEANEIIAMIGQLPHSDFLVVSGVNNGYDATEQGPAGAQYLKILEFNSILQAAYPDNYLDLHGIMVADGIANADAQSVNYDAPPSYWAPTDVHFNADGSAKAVQEIRAKLLAIGALGTAALRRQIARCGNR